MGNIRHFKYAARDGYAGAAQYNEHSDYVKSKNIIIEGPHKQLEAVQITLSTYYELQNALSNHENIISKMAQDCPQGVSAGREFFAKGELGLFVENGSSVADVFNTICMKFKF